ncbi:MAG: YciI family protein [Acidiferrobacterales bacterium]|nr:YciI family protein [Acidiferrobacterales bacterium]
MQFMALIYSSEAAGDDVDFDTLISQYRQFGEEAGAAGVLTDQGAALQPVSTATSVKLRDGKAVITDGPFAETKEQLGGYYILECKDLDDALHWAAKIPSARYGTVEVRPVMEIDD